MSANSPAAHSESHGIEAKLLSDFGAFIAAGSRFLIATHENPDADAYGSACGLGLALRGIGKQVAFLNSTALIDRFSFIPSAHELSTRVSSDFKADAIIICDCGSYARVGETIEQQLRKLSALPLLNIDHHVSNDNFGSSNIVIPEASSSAEVVCALLDGASIPFTPAVAVALYAGIVADSGSFRYSSVRPYTFAAAARCVENGAGPWRIAQQLFSSDSLERVRLHAEAMLRMRLVLENRVALIIAPADLVRRCGAETGDSDGLAEKGRDIKGVIVSILMKEDGDLWRVSLRSKSDQVDVSDLAQTFGGGGHKVAAAFRSRKPQAEIESELLSELKERLSRLTTNAA